jgi:hypothetical protein
MKNYKIILLLFLTMVGQYVSAQVEVKKPKEAFELFFGTFVNNDEVALNKLNDYLRPTVEGQNAYQVNFKETSDEMKKGTVENFLAAFPKLLLQHVKKRLKIISRPCLKTLKPENLPLKR